MTSTSTTKELSIKVIPFSGKQEDWETWEEKFLARARRMKYKDLLTGKDSTVVVPKSTATTLTADEKLIEELNIQAYEDLILSIDTSTDPGKVAFSLVKSTKVKGEYDDGDCIKAWKNLVGRYNPTTAPHLCRINSKFYSAKMNKDADPTQYITYMEDLRIHLQSSGQKMSDMQFIMQIVNTLPKEYESSVEQIEKDMSTMDIGKIRDLLFLKFHRL